MNIEEAIAYIEACRDTHIETVKYYDSGGTPEKWIQDYGIASSLGDREFHQKCVDDYDEVLKTIRKLLLE